MLYKKLIQENFLIDEPKTGELVPFIFNKVQEKYYQTLVDEYDIENKGLGAPVRENILKARREGFSSLILALFAADDIATENPTETCVLSYKDDATNVFRKRYRTFVLSFFARRKMKLTVEEIKKRPGILDEVAKKFLSQDGTDIELAHNKAHFYCGTASARVGGRGGVVQKQLFSEIAYYPDTEKMTAKEIVEGTMRQVDVASGWVFAESTENGRGTYQYKLWMLAKQGMSRFKNRFFGAGEFYDEKQLQLIRSEFVDMDMFKREYPMTEEDLFSSSQLSFITEEELKALVKYEHAEKEIVMLASLKGTNYIEQCEILASILDSLVRKYPKNALYGGIDIAKQHDKTVLTVIRTKGFSLNGGIKCLAIDSTGMGDFMPDWFERNTRYYLERVKFSRMTKDIMYSTLTAVIKKKLTAIPELVVDGKYTSPEAEGFYNEMIELEKSIVGEMIVVSHPGGDEYHDDFPDSWALAEHAYSFMNGVEKRDKPTSALTIPNAVERLLNKTGSRSTIVDDSYF